MSRSDLSGSFLLISEGPTGDLVGPIKAIAKKIKAGPTEPTLRYKKIMQSKSYVQWIDTYNQKLILKLYLKDAAIERGSLLSKDYMNEKSHEENHFMKIAVVQRMKHKCNIDKLSDMNRGNPRFIVILLSSHFHLSDLARVVQEV
jgi:hypothetical protein